MKCPKCQYITFDSGTRCRNCGYDLSLTENPRDTDLPITPEHQPIGPLTDLPLATQEPARGREELPLFAGRGAHDDAPLVSAPAVPRAPLAVRRPAPAMPKPRARSGTASEPELDLESPTPLIVRHGREDARIPETIEAPNAAESGQVASALSRIVAAAIDVALVGGIDAAVLYLTLRLTGLSFADIAVLPKVPLIAFLLLLNGGYFVLFTAAGGQTVGKMAGGIRVVPQQAETGPKVPFSTAVVRAASYAISLLPAGLGFLPIVFSQDGRTLHDRLADTRVVKA